MIRFDNLPPDVMQAMCTPMHQIIPPSASSRTGALYLGSFSAILDPDLLNQNRISALVQVLDAPWLPSVDAHAKQGVKLDCFRLDIMDSTTADLKPHLEATVRWIDEKLRKGANVLVHCQQVCFPFYLLIWLIDFCLNSLGRITICCSSDRIPHLHP